MFVAHAPLVALLALSATPDLETGVRTEAGGGYAPISTRDSAGRIYFNLIPHLGLILSTHAWSVRVDYMPRIYTRIPRDDATDPFLALNVVTGQYTHNLGHGWSVLVGANWSWGQSDYGRASLIADDTGNPAAIPPASILYTEAGGATGALTVPMPGRDRLVLGVGGTYTKLAACTYESPCWVAGGDQPVRPPSNETAQAYPTQARGNVDATYVSVLSARNQLTGNLRGVWQAIIPTDPTGTSTTTHIRTLSLSGTFEHRFSRSYRASATLGLGTGITEEGGPAEIRPLPVLSVFGAMDKTVGHGTRLTGSVNLGLEGFVNPLIRRYQPRLSANVGAALIRSDLTVGLTLVGFTTVFDAPSSQPTSGCIAPIDGDYCAALETGLAITVPVTYHVSRDFSLELSARASGLLPQLGAPVDPQDLTLRQRELFFTFAVVFDHSTQRRAGAQ